MGYEDRLGDMKGFEEGVNVLRSTKYKNLSFNEVVNSLNETSKNKQLESDTGYWICKMRRGSEIVTLPLYYKATSDSYFYSNMDVYGPTCFSSEIERIKKLDLSEYED